MTFCKAKFVAALAAVLSFSAASAQIGIHGTVTGQRIGGITCPAYAAPCANNGGEVKPFGGDFGAYYDFRDLGPARLGVDLRGETLVANKRGDTSAGGGKIDRHYSLLGGVRASFTVRKIPALHPYAEILGGIDRNNDTGLYTSTTTTLNVAPTPVVTKSLTYNPDLYKNYGVVKGVVGLDVRLSPLVDLRVLELGVGEMFGSAPNLQATSVQQDATGKVTSTSTSTATSGQSTHGIQTIGIGIVFRFGQR